MNFYHHNTLIYEDNVIVGKEAVAIIWIFKIILKQVLLFL